jgi:hypothetical protein
MHMLGFAQISSTKSLEFKFDLYMYSTITTNE